MTTLFTWSSHNSDHQHPDNLETQDIIQLTIQQKESGFAHATITCLPIEIQPYDQGIISYKGRTLFKGAYISHRYENYLLTIELLAKPQDYNQQCEKSKAYIQQQWPDLIINKESSLEDLAKSLQAMPHTCRADNTLTLERFNYSTRVIALSSNDILGNFTTKKMPLPKGTHMQTQHEWVQNISGSFDLYPIIAKQFKGGMISTLTPQSVQENWPKLSNGIAKNLGQSGLQITASSIGECIPPATGILNLYPNETIPLDNTNGKKVVFKRSWLKGKLIISWQYLQKRREQLTLTNKKDDTEPTLHKVDLSRFLELQAESTNSHFFDHEQNENILKFVHNLFKTEQHKQARSLEIHLTLAFDKFYTIDTNTIVTINDLPGYPSLTGKVVDYKLVQDQTNQHIHVKLACFKPETEKPYVFALTSHPIEGFVRKKFDQNDLVESITVSNCAEVH